MGKNVIKDITELKANATALADDEAQAMIINEVDGSWGVFPLHKTLIPKNSRERTFKENFKSKAKPTYLLVLGKEELHAIELPKEKATVSGNGHKGTQPAVVSVLPSDLYGALNWEELGELLHFTDSLTERIKLGVFFVLCAFLIIVLFLISIAAMGGN